MYIHSQKDSSFSYRNLDDFRVDLKLPWNIFLHFSFSVLYRIIELLRRPRGISHQLLWEAIECVSAITRENTSARSVHISGLLLIFYCPIFRTEILHYYFIRFIIFLFIFFPIFFFFLISKYRIWNIKYICKRWQWL